MRAGKSFLKFTAVDPSDPSRMWSPLSSVSQNRGRRSFPVVLQCAFQWGTPGWKYHQKQSLWVLFMRIQSCYWQVYVLDWLEFQCEDWTSYTWRKLPNTYCEHKLGMAKWTYPGLWRTAAVLGWCKSVCIDNTLVDLHLVNILILLLLIFSSLLSCFSAFQLNLVLDIIEC